MTQKIGISCKCRSLQGAVERLSFSEGVRLVCHCTDCQDFARFLGNEERTLDENGGTDLFQTRCARLRIDKGLNQLSCLHLTEKPTLRWYADCCRTPMFNTYANGKLPYLTVLTTVFEESQPNDILGPALGHLHLSDAVGDVSNLVPMSMGLMLRRFLPGLIKDVVSGDRRRAILFDPDTLEPIKQPHRLTDVERKASLVQ